MTETAEVPALDVGPEQEAAWREARQAVAYALREYRLQDRRLAWSDATAAERAYDRLVRQADPAVRAMTADEQAAWARRHEQPDRDPGAVYTRRTDGAAGTVAVTVEPCLQRWGLEARGTTTDGRVVAALVSCADPAIATRLADDIAAAGADAVGRLQEFATRAAERAAAARSELRETEEQRLARTAATAHEVWAGPLAEAITGSPAPGYDLTASPAFGALAWRLHELEERGYAMVDVLRWVDDRRLRGPNVENPAALAAHFVEQLLDRLPAINLDPPGTEKGVDSGMRPAHRADPAADPAGWDDEEIETANAVDQILASALPSDVLQAVRDGAGYDDARRVLHGLYDQGLPVDRLLSGLPLENMLASDSPATNLVGALERRAEQQRPPPIGVDQVAMVELVHQALPPPVADKVTGCWAWPGLAKRLAAWQQQGLPVEVMLESLPVWDIDRHRRPARYTTDLMHKQVDEYLAQVDFTTYLSEPLTSSLERGPTPGSAGTGSGEARGDADLDDADLDDLDIEALVENAVAEARPRADTAAAAEARAETHEQAAARNRAAPDRPDTQLREDHIGGNTARADERLAARERAAAAEERGAATAAAERAAVTYTPDAAHQSARQAELPSARPGPTRVPMQVRSRERHR